MVQSKKWLYFIQESVNERGLETMTLKAPDRRKFILNNKKMVDSVTYHSQTGYSGLDLLNDSHWQTPQHMHSGYWLCNLEVLRNYESSNSPGKDSHCAHRNSQEPDCQVISFCCSDHWGRIKGRFFCLANWRPTDSSNLCLEKNELQVTNRENISCRYS